MKEGLVEVLENWWFSKITDMHTCLPGRIVEYYGHSERKAKIQLSIKYKTITGKIYEYPAIDNVPIMFQSSSDFSLVYPLKKDDGVLVLFSETGIGNFLAGDATVESDTPDRFGMGDAIAIPGLWSFKTVPDAPDNDDDFFLTFGKKSFTIEQNSDIIILKNQGSEIKMDGSKVTINSNLEVNA